MFKNKTRSDQVTTFISKFAFSKMLLLVSFIGFSVDCGASPIMVNVLNT